MLKHPITYEDFNGNTVTEDFYFNISKPELVELDVDYTDGLGPFIESITKNENHKELVALFKRVILLAVGEKSEDGKHFVKSEEISKNFSFTNAYPELFVRMATDAEFAADFLIGIFPKDLAEGLKKELEKKAAVEQKPEPVSTPPVP